MEIEQNEHRKQGVYEIKRNHKRKETKNAVHSLLLREPDAHAYARAKTVFRLALKYDLLFELNTSVKKSLF